MQKIQNKIKENNKGFTLVELIIVVAIIVILAAVLAPQYTRYVERSRQSNDLQVATSIMDAALVAMSDPENEIPSGQLVTVRWYTANGSKEIDVYSYNLRNATHSNGTGLLDNLKAEIDSVLAFDGGRESALSEAGNSQHFVFRVDTETGKIEVADTNPTPDTSGWNGGSGLWVTEIGVNAPLSSAFNY